MNRFFENLKALNNEIDLKLRVFVGNITIDGMLINVDPTEVTMLDDEGYTYFLRTERIDLVKFSKKKRPRHRPIR